MSNILESLLGGLGDFLSTTAGMQLVSFAIIGALVGFMFSIPARINNNTFRRYR